MDLCLCPPPLLRASHHTPHTVASTMAEGVAPVRSRARSRSRSPAQAGDNNSTNTSNHRESDTLGAKRRQIKRPAVSDQEKKLFLRANYVGISLFHAMNFYLLYMLVKMLSSWADVSLAVLAVFSGAFVIDFYSYIGHWCIDNYGTEDTPMVGKKVILTFRVHHDDQMAICEHGWWEANGNTCFASIPCSAIVIYQLSKYWSPGNDWAIFLAGFTIGFWGLFSVANQMHIWSHMYRKDLPWIVRALQSVGILISKENHANHHADGARSHYALVTGWTNELCEILRISTILEWFFRHTFGVEPFTKMEQEMSAEELNNRKITRWESVTFPVMVFPVIYLSLFIPCLLLLRQFLHTLPATESMSV